LTLTLQRDQMLQREEPVTILNATTVKKLVISLETANLEASEEDQETDTTTEGIEMTTEGIDTTIEETLDQDPQEEEDLQEDLEIEMTLIPIGTTEVEATTPEETIEIVTTTANTITATIQRIREETK
jgi:hypothetical protein